MLRKAAGLVVVGALAVALMPGGVSAKPGGQPAIPLNPEQETNVVDSPASGFFSYTIAGDQLCYTLEVRDLTTQPVGAHIHVGEREVAGPIVVPLITPPATTSTVSDCITAVGGSSVMTPEELEAIEADPRGFYVNAHTQRYRPGEVRGQLK